MKKATILALLALAGCSQQPPPVVYVYEPAQAAASSAYEAALEAQRDAEYAAIMAELAAIEAAL